MASLECGICGNGIHYHDEADGTQILFIKLAEWNRLIKTDMFISRYLLDGTEDYCFAWKCKACGSLIMLDPVTWQVTNKYKPSETAMKDSTDSEQYIVFDDTTWDKITEERIRGEELFIKYPDLEMTQALVNKDGMVIYSGESRKGIINSYIAQ